MKEAFIRPAHIKLTEINNDNVVFLICWKGFENVTLRGGGDLSLFLSLLIIAIPLLPYLYHGLFTGYESFITIFQKVSWLY